MRRLIFICLTVVGLFVVPHTTVAQDSSQTQARAFYFAAEDALESRDYDEAYRALKRAEEVRGRTDARFLELEAKILVAQGKDKDAFRVIEKFYQYDASPELLRSVAQLQLGIEEREEARRAEEARLAEQRRLAEIRRLQYEEEQRQKEAETARRLAPVDVVEQGERAAQIIIQRVEQRTEKIKNAFLAQHKSFDARRKRVKGKKGSYGAFFEVLDVRDFSLASQCQSDGALHRFYNLDLMFKVSTYKKSKRTRTENFNIRVKGLKAKVSLWDERELKYDASAWWRANEKIFKTQMPSNLIEGKRVGGVSYIGHPSEEFATLIQRNFYENELIATTTDGLEYEFPLAMQKDRDLFVQSIRSELLRDVKPCN